MRMTGVATHLLNIACHIQSHRRHTTEKKMAFNLTGIDEDSYFVVSSAVNVSLFSTIILIPLLLCLLCLVALALATINLKVKVLLMNIFVVEVCNQLRYTVLYLGFPARILQLPGDYSCHVFYGLSTAALQQKFIATALYAIMVFVFIKYGEKRLKWRVIIPMITVSWIATIATSGTLPFYASEYGHQTINGFCIVNPQSPVFISVMSVIMLIVVICLIIIVIFCILIFVYIKKNIIEENAEVKKAVSKVLFYLLLSSVLAFVNNVIPMLNPAIKRALADRNVVDFLAVDYLFRVVFNLPAIATPIVSIILLKPIRIAMQRLFCVCCKHTTAERN